MKENVFYAFVFLLVLVFGVPCKAESGRIGGEVVVDRVVALVGAAGDSGRDISIITAYELDIEARLLLAERSHSVDGIAGRPIPQRLLDSVLETMIDHQLIVGEASRFQLISVTEEDIESERQNIEQRLGGPGSLVRFQTTIGVPRELVDGILRRRALVAAFIQRNIQISTRVADADIEEAYRSGDHPFGDLPLEEIRASLDAFLVARRQRERLAQWLEETRGRSRIRIIEQ